MKRVKAARPPLRVIVTHHKVLTVLMRQVFAEVANRYGLVFRCGTGGAIDPATDIHQDMLGRTARANWPCDRGTPRGIHLRRDPRDVVVSGYFYHLNRCQESWCLAPDPALGGRSYQETLRGLPTEEGLLFELAGNGTMTINNMLGWDYEAPNVLELRYEDFMGDFESSFRRAFGFLGFNVRRCLRLARPHAFAAKTGRQPGEIDPGSHLRNGLPGQWRQHFTPRLLAAFHERFPDAVARLGYDAA